LKLWHIRKWGG